MKFTGDDPDEDCERFDAALLVQLEDERITLSESLALHNHGFRVMTPAEVDEANARIAAIDESLRFHPNES